MNEHAQRSMKRWHRRGLLGQLFVPKANERYCQHCNRPMPPQPQPKALAEHLRGDLGAMVYPAGAWGRPSLVVRFGRWRASSNRFYLSEYVPAEELSEFIRLVLEVQASLTEFAKSTKRRRS